LALLAASNAFRDSARHRRLLEFLVGTTLKGESDGLKEFVIAAEVWDRNVSFDPRIHSMVRVEVGRLRTRLERYYSGEGAHDDLRFSIPVGGYRVAGRTPRRARSSAARTPPASGMWLFLISTASYNPIRWFTAPTPAVKVGATAERPENQPMCYDSGVKAPDGMHPQSFCHGWD
jgi:hypothetical protein